MSENATSTPQPGGEDTLLTWGEFLATVPPGQRRTVGWLAERTGEGSWNLATPPIKLFCDNSACDSETFFDREGYGVTPNYDNLDYKFLLYRCRHCKQSWKLFAVFVRLAEKDRQTLRGEAEKIGEFPAFGPHVPTRLNKLIGEDRECFFKGRRAECQGMGIGAFGYYRRVVENQKNRIIDEIIKVCQRIGANPKVIAELQAARKETQFIKAVGKIKKGIPDALKIDGHNPLVLLHSALSEGLHAQTDAECLEIATSIRVVMAELAERLDLALKEEAELKSAVSRLLKTQPSKGGKAIKAPQTQTGADVP